jgi:hypothetical protein
MKTKLLLTTIFLCATSALQASVIYNFTGILSGTVWDYGGNWPPVPVVASFENLPFTGSVHHDTDSQDVGVSILTSDGLAWLAGADWSEDITTNPFTLTFPFGAVSSYFTFGSLFLELDPDGTGFFTYTGDARGNSIIEDTSGIITSYHSVPDTGTTLGLFLIGLATVIGAWRLFETHYVNDIVRRTKRQ